MALMHTLSTQFNDATDFTLSGATVSGGKLNIVADTSWNGASTTASYDLTGSYLIVECEPANSGEPPAETELQFRPAVGDWQSAINVYWNNGVVGMGRGIDGTFLNAFEIAYNSTDHKYLRIRELAGTIYGDTSPDGLSWTQQGSIATSSLPITALYVLFQAYAATGSYVAIFDNINPVAAAVNGSARWWKFL